VFEGLKKLCMNTCFSRNCVPGELMFDQKAHCIAVSAEHLCQFEFEEKHIPRVTCDELWVCCFTPESKWSNMEWSDKRSPHKKD
jgi:hypothetical protein